MATQAEIAALYQQYLGRAPDAGGLEFYLNPDFSLELIESDIAGSPEAESFRAQQYAQGTPATREEIAGLYQDIFGRDPDEAGLDFYDQSDFSTDQIRQNFLASPELKGIEARPYAQGTPATAEEINALYREYFGRDADKEGMQFYDASDFSADQIRQQLMGSSEYSTIQQQKNQSTAGTGTTGGSTGGSTIPTATTGGGVQTVGTGSQSALFDANTPYQSELIRSLRAASAGQPQTANSGVTMLQNPVMNQATQSTDWLDRAAPTGLSNNVQPFPTPASPTTDTSDDSSSSGGGSGGGGSGDDGTTDAVMDSGYSNPYFQANPDVAQMYEQNFQTSMTPDAYAMEHWLNYGMTEGREGWKGPVVNPGEAVFGSGNGSIYANQGG